jgi:hypothetical protein
MISGLNSPVYLTAPPGDTDRLFVVGRLGTIRILKDGVPLLQPFLDIQDLVTSQDNFELGLLGLAFDPDFDTNGYFYVYYTREAATPYESTIQRFTVSSNPDIADESSITSVLTVPQTGYNHKGGTLHFGPDGYLYLGLGDGGDDAENAQNPLQLLGKMIRIDPHADDFPADPVQNYAIPPDNPFAESIGVRGEIWALGFRNPYRFSFDPATGDLYVGDVGLLVREEIDYQPSTSTGGENYGWPRMEGTVCNVPPVDCDDGTLTHPIHDYPHSPTCSAVVGGVVYRGAELPSWLQGHYFFADFCQGPPYIWSFRVVGGQVTEFTDWTDALQPDIGPPIAFIAAFGVDAIGEMYLVEMRNTNGKIYRIVPDPAVDAPSVLPSAGSILRLSAGAPNPFPGSTKFVLELARATDVEVLVHEATGRLVRTLRLGRLPAGEHAFSWDGRDGSGATLASGTYFVRTSAAGQTMARRVTLLR